MTDRAKLFKTGGSQAVRLPRAYRFLGQTEVAHQAGAAGRAGGGPADVQPAIPRRSRRPSSRGPGSGEPWHICSTPTPAVTTSPGDTRRASRASSRVRPTACASASSSSRSCGTEPTTAPDAGEPRTHRRPDQGDRDARLLPPGRRCVRAGTGSARGGGTLIGPNDMLIAAHALSRGLRGVAQRGRQLLPRIQRSLDVHEVTGLGAPGESRACWPGSRTGCPPRWPCRR